MSNFLDNYPTRESRDNPETGVKGMWPLFGYNSEMVNMALNKDDPEGFIHFMRLCNLDHTARTFDGLSMQAYCRKRGALLCMAALKKFEEPA